MAEEIQTDVESAPVDNARGMTDALVYTTAGLLLVAFIVMEKALAKWFAAGMFA